ncbi:MAG: bifunctional nuclease family protein [Anaerolineales bacterium]|nr:bifunctional nuclease family protein [Anaerolineales bacterium]
MSSEMIEVVIDSVRVHLMTPHRVVVLKQTDEERYLTVWVGAYEAEAITVAMQEVEVARPLTHDLIRNVLKAFNARVLRVEIVKLESDIFYGNIVVETEGREIQIDSRPSDAIALAVRARAPIFVRRDVMDAAGVFRDEDLLNRPSESAKREKETPLLPDDADDRLSVFKDFIEKLNIDDSDKDNPDQPKK